MATNKSAWRMGAAPLLASLFLGGCASFSQDGGMNEVASLTQSRTSFRVERTGLNNSPAVQARIDQLLAAPLNVDGAVETALLNNRGLQASLAELGVAEADLVQAGRMRNPGFSFGRMRAGYDVEIERSIVFDLVGLLTIPLRTQIEQSRFERARLEAAAAAIRLAAETRRAYFEAVAAAQMAQYMLQVQGSAEAGAELAQRMARVGNWSKLDQAREQAFYAETTAQLARARQQAFASREQLIRLLGVQGKNINIALPEKLPDLPATANEPGDIEAIANAQRLDIQMAKRDAESTARALGLTKATGFVNVLELGYANKSETGAPRQNGYEISLELPLFDWGGARTAKAQALYMQSIHRAADIAVQAHSQVREAYTSYRMSYDTAKHYRDNVIPLRKQISEEVLLRYNGMLASVFELLSDARDQVSSVSAAIEAQRDFWIAESNLQSALTGTGPGGAAPSRAASTRQAQQEH